MLRDSRLSVGLSMTITSLQIAVSMSMTNDYQRDNHSNFNPNHQGFVMLRLSGGQITRSIGQSLL